MLGIIEFNIYTVIAIVSTVLYLIYKYYTKDYDYWTSRGVNGPKPVIFLGTCYFIFVKYFHEIFEDNYKKYGRIYGTFLGTRPVINIGDPQLIKDIAIRDFNLFTDRNDISFGDKIQDRSLFNAFGDDWKHLRQVISPAFSSAKMKKMHSIIEDCADSLDKALLKHANNANNEIELLRLMGNYTMDVIATCAFATKVDTHNDASNQFVEYAERVFRKNNLRMFIFFFLKFTFPKLLDTIGYTFTNPEVANFFRSAIRTIIGFRKKESGSEIHQDFLQLMMDAHKRVPKSLAENKKEKEEREGLEEIDILASAFLFLVAGFDTTANMLAFLFYKLALYPECQEKLYKEVMTLNGNYDYDNLAKLPYLEACINETLRLYQPLSAITRIALQDYKLGDTGITIPKGMIVNFNVQGVHRDPEFYPNPELFDPERFMPENRDKLVPYAHMPFGLGPRNCVGMRFAFMESKSAIVRIVSKFKFVPSANTKCKVEFSKYLFILQAKEIRVAVEMRDKQ